MTTSASMDAGCDWAAGAGLSASSAAPAIAAVLNSEIRRNPVQCPRSIDRVQGFPDKEVKSPGGIRFDALQPDGDPDSPEQNPAIDLTIENGAKGQQSVPSGGRDECSGAESGCGAR